MSLLFVLALLIYGNSVNGQFQRMFQQNIVDQPPDTGKILIQSELKIETLEMPEDCAKKAISGDTLVFDYEGLINGVHIEDSHNTGEKGATDKEPLVVPTGKGAVIPGLEAGVLGMCIGEKRKLIIPPHLAFGEKGVADVIPENAEITFIVTLLEIVPKSWGEWYVDIVWSACYLAFVGGIIVLMGQGIQEKRKALRREQKKARYYSR
ncbi:peptidyl-prolyl cis-trans isomerase FKBP9-like [Saccostrea echinata]|uniref:peptidyl-prolyl cis-trans isomerase FKBP9-like n=1 Tax=Saccostrea echinata TaxID=191078 RepID=UPI002A7FDD48|nr:peptidyl-prolyl cis-trans isomerase FKBP9-like [Saccostrea echinata]